MKIQSLPKDLLIEVLHYLADHGSLEGLDQVLGRQFLFEDTRAALRELAVQLSSELEQEREQKGITIPWDDLSLRTRKLLTSLSPGEERRLLRAFRFFDF